MSGVQNKKSKPTRFTRLFCLNSLRETPSFTRLKIEENIKAKNKDEIQRPNLRRNTKEKIKTKYKDQREGYENMFQMWMVLVCAKLAP